MSNETDTTSKAVGQEDAQPVKAPIDETLSKVVEKIESADSILVALSRDPSVDEIAAAIGLTLSLDRMGKHATAIYSGKTPNALEFLEPEKTFESNTNSLQDFIIALDKEKADHLRYKIEGDFVKVYITPYRTTITEKDLEFSHGEVNVDMVISLNVIATEDLDTALAEHGRIMHDAISINISNGTPGRLGGLEWNDTRMSSVSEMVLKYLLAAKQSIEKDVATALLTGIVSATERFSNQKTTPETMAASAELMKYGADQQLIVAHMEDVQKPEPEEVPEVPAGEQVEPGSIDVSHEGEEPASESAADYVNPLDIAKAATAEALGTEAPETSIESVEPVEPVESAKSPNIPTESPNEETPGVSAETLSAVPADATGTDSKSPDNISPEQELEQMISGKSSSATGPLMQELVEAAKAEEEKTKQSEENTPTVQADRKELTDTPELKIPDLSEQVLSIDKSDAPTVQPTDESSTEAAVQSAEVPVDQVYNQPEEVKMNDGVITPTEETEQPKDYGAMMEEALAEPMNTMPNPAISAAPSVATTPEIQPVESAPGMNMAGLASTAIPTAPMTNESDVSAMVNQIVNQPQVVPAADSAPIAAEPIPAPSAAPELPPPPAPPIAPVDSYGTMPPETPSLPPVQGVPEVPASETQPPVLQGAQDTSAAFGIPEAPQGVAPPPEPINPVVVQPIQDPATVPPVADPGAFKIPGM